MLGEVLYIPSRINIPRPALPQFLKQSSMLGIRPGWMDLWQVKLADPSKGSSTSTRVQTSILPMPASFGLSIPGSLNPQ